MHPDVVDGVRALSELGIRMVTLSNGSSTVADRLLQGAGVREAFERLLTVEDAGVWKPAARAYAYALEGCGVDPEDAMLVAVHPWDIDGASRAGLATAWINRSDGGRTRRTSRRRTFGQRRWWSSPTHWGDARGGPSASRHEPRVGLERRPREPERVEVLHGRELLADEWPGCASEKVPHRPGLLVPERPVVGSGEVQGPPPKFAATAATDPISAPSGISRVSRAETWPGQCQSTTRF